MGREMRGREERKGGGREGADKPCKEQAKS